jgi:hypothetical protein
VKSTPLIASALLILATRCSRTSSSPASGDAGAVAPLRGKAPGLGEVMVQVGRRFELVGRAAAANRFELAEFEVGELEELFEDDVPNAELPKEGPTAHIPALAQGFLKTNLPEMKKAAAAKAAVEFQDTFRRAASSCNACHQASAKGFIQIPTAPGKPVPDLDPVVVSGKAQ